MSLSRSASQARTPRCSWNRGWIPYEMAGPERRKEFQQAAGEVEVRGILRRTEVRSSQVSPADLPLGPNRPRLDAWHHVDLPRIQEQIPYPLLPLYLEERSRHPAHPSGASLARRGR